MVTNPHNKAKKSFGQHFLHDEHVLTLMCEDVHGGTTTPILEIGPGTGTLTTHLLKTKRPIVALEKDPTLLNELREKFASYKNFQLLHQDVLTFLPPKEWESGYSICANIPYYITQPIITHFLWEVEQFPLSLTLMVQHEVAQKYTQHKAPYSFLSASAALIATTEYVAFVPRKLFTPPPKVDSAILTFTLLKEPREIWLRKLTTVMHNCFRNGRKKLSNVLEKHYQTKVLGSVSAHLLEMRPEMLTPKDWRALGKAIFE